ncbi:MAG: LysR family transcriptional regulator [Pseudomonadota bacterium]
MTSQFHYKNNRFQQLKGFCAAISNGSISKAAKQMNLSQGAVSLQIQSLERDLGVKLLKRENSKISLTKEGKIFYARAAASVQEVNEMFSDFAKFLRHEKLKTINIAANNVSICYILPKYIHKFETTNPEVEFEIRNIPKDEAIKRLKNNEIDFAIYSAGDDEVPDELDFLPIVCYQPILLTRKDHPLAKKKNLILSDIAKYKLIRLDRRFTTIPNFDEIAKVNKIKTKIEFEMANYEILKKFVKANIGIAIVSSICLEGEDEKDLQARMLIDYFPEIKYGIWFKKGKKFFGLPEEFIKLLTTEKLLHAQDNMDYLFDY